METSKITSKVVNARLEQVDTESMADYNAAVEGRKRVRCVFSALSENMDATANNSFASFCAKHTSNALYSIILNFDGAKNDKGVLLSDDEVKALIWAEAQKANNVLPLTIVNVPLSAVFDDIADVWTSDGVRISVQTLAYVGVADMTETAIASVRNRVTKRLASGDLLKTDPTVATTVAPTIVG